MSSTRSEDDMVLKTLTTEPKSITITIIMVKLSTYRRRVHFCAYLSIHCGHDKIEKPIASHIIDKRDRGDMLTNVYSLRTPMHSIWRTHNVFKGQTKSQIECTDTA